MIEKYYAVRWKEGNTAIKFGSWNTVSKTIQGHPGVTFKSFLLKEDAEEWLLKDSIPFRDKDTPFQKDKIYMFVDGSFSSKRMVSGWGFVAIRNYKTIFPVPNVTRHPRFSCHNRHKSRTHCFYGRD